jgi:MtN3 and saliva related transmembrane protein
VVCWLAYGIYKVDWPIIVANAVSVVLSSIILIFKIINVAKGEKTTKRNN